MPDPTIVITFLGAADTINDAAQNHDPSDLNGFNNDAQTVALAASLGSNLNPLKAGTAFSSNGGAAATAVGLTISDYNNPQKSKMEIAGDGLQALGDAISAAAALKNMAPGGGMLWNNLDKAGPLITILGLMAKNGPSWVMGSTALYNILQSIVGAPSGGAQSNPFAQLGQGDAINNAWWGGVQTSLDNMLKDVGNLINSPSPSDPSTLTSDINNLNNDFQNISTNSGFTLQNTTSTINGSAVAIASSIDDSVIDNGVISTDNLGNITGVTTIGSDGSKLTEGLTVNGDNVTDTTQGYNSNDVLQYTQTTDFSSTGQMISNLSADGVVANIDGSDPTVSLDNSGNVQASLAPSSITGLWLDLQFSSNFATLNEDGNLVLAAGTGSSITEDDQGNFDVSSNLAGWSQTTALNFDGSFSQSFSATDAQGNPISLTDYFQPLTAPVVSRF